MNYLKKKWANANSKCDILIYDRRHDFSELAINITVSTYDQNHKVNKSFNNSIILPIDELSKYCRGRNIESVIDDLIKNIFTSKVSLYNENYKYHITNDCIYARKWFTKFIVCSDKTQIELIKNAIIKYYNKRELKCYSI